MAGSKGGVKSEVETPAKVQKATVDSTGDVKVDAETIAPPPAVEKAVVKPNVNAETQDWDPAEFQRDALYFALTCGLPNAGLNPMKITDIDDAMLKEYFGEKSRNGYKLSNCSKLSVEDLLELSQVVDGYDRPVNGVLSHSFVKGVYAERIQGRSVNWATYAFAKLKGQIVQWGVYSKGKPEGPPCVRKPRMYKSPTAMPEDFDADTKQLVAEKKPDLVASVVDVEKSQPLAQVVAAGDASHQIMSPVDSFQSPANDVASLNFKEKTDGLRPFTLSPPEVQPPHLLVVLLSQSMSTTSANERRVREDILKMAEKLETLKKAGLEQPKTWADLNNQVETAKAELVDVQSRMEKTDADTDTITVKIEMEENKEEVESEVTTDYMSILQARLESNKKVADELRGRESTINREIDTLKNLIVTKEKYFKELSVKVARAESLQSALQADLSAVLAMLEAQSKEKDTLADVLKHPCPLLMPRFIPTSTHTVATQIALTSFPVCCNGFHCFNWIPASCGHTYHPVCLFSLIGKSVVRDPRCYACGEIFAHDWLRSWGLEYGDRIPVGAKRYFDEIRDCYGKHSGRLGRRREVVTKMQSAQQKGDFHGEDELLRHSPNSLGATSIVDLETVDVEHGSSKVALLTPKLEPGEPGKKRKAEGESEGSRKGKKGPQGRPKPRGRNTPF